MSNEVWDAYDKHSNKLGFDLIRGEAIPESVYHIVVEVVTVTEDREVLITQRHPDKPWGSKWEITGGSILRGETPEQGAVRELQEETGICITEDDLNFVYSHPTHDTHAIYKCFLVFVEKSKIQICLQEGETVDHRFLPYEEGKSFVWNGDFTAPQRDRLSVYEKVFDQLIDNHFKAI